MPRTPVEELIPRGDKLILRAFPKVAQRLENSVDELGKSELDSYLKILPGTIERFQAVTTTANELPESVENSILQLVASFKSFGPRNTATVESGSALDISNASSQLEETMDSVSSSDQPEGSGTDQQVSAESLSRNDLEATAGSGEELGKSPAGKRNPRVKTRSPFSGRMAKVLDRRRMSGEDANDQGRLPGSDGRVKGTGE